MLVKIDQRKMQILIRLYKERFNPGSKQDFVRKFDSDISRSGTFEIVNELIRLNILTFSMEEEVNGIRRAFYTVDRKRLSEFWKKRLEFELSRCILDEEGILFE